MILYYGHGTLSFVGGGSTGTANYSITLPGVSTGVISAWSVPVVVVDQSKLWRRLMAEIFACFVGPVLGWRRPARLLRPPPARLVGERRATYARPREMVGAINWRRL